MLNKVTEDDPDLARPDPETVKEVIQLIFIILNDQFYFYLLILLLSLFKKKTLKTTEKTRKALEMLVSAKVQAAMPVKAAEKQAPAQYIRYTPAQQGSDFNSGANQRIIRMVEVQRDPMSPPRFK